jgi:hypothetical protein
VFGRLRPNPPGDAWSPRGRLLLRFACLYALIYSFTTQLAGGVFLVPGRSIPALGSVWPLRNLTEWLATSVLGLPAPLVFSGNSGDTAFHWVQLAVVLTAAVSLTIAWTLSGKTLSGKTLSGKPRVDDDLLHDGFRLFVRFVLAGQMFYYGMAKVVPSQFQAPSLVTLIQPVGSLSLADLLWTFIGASLPYQMAAGVAEVLAGLLLVVPRTAVLGALVCLLDMLQVFVLNMAYDFGLKQLSFHLAVLALALVAPNLPGLTAWFIRRREAPAPHEERVPGVTSTAGVRRATVAQVLFGVYLLAVFANLSLQFWRTEGDGRPRSPLYGIWDVTALWVDEARVPPIDADYDRRWRRVVFDTPDVVAFQRLDDSIAHYGSVFQGDRGFQLSKGRSRSWRATFDVERRDTDRMRLDGDMDGHKIRVELTRVGLDTFRLRGSRFRWVRPPDPFAG